MALSDSLDVQLQDFVGVVHSGSYPLDEWGQQPVHSECVEPQPMPGYVGKQVHGLEMGAVYSVTEFYKQIAEFI